MYAIFHVDTFLNLFGQELWTSYTIRPLIGDVSRFVCPTYIYTFATAIQYGTHAILHEQLICPA